MPNESWYRDRLLEKFNKLGAEGASKDADLFRVKFSYTEVLLTYMTYIQPVIGVVYFIFVIASFILLWRADILAYVNGVYLFCSFVKCLPIFLVGPIDIAFLYFAQTDAPMPYPWCFCFLLLQDALKKISHLTTTYLSILLAVNRYCSLYYPLKFRIWFSKFRNRIYCSSTFIVVFIIGVFLNNQYLQIKEQVLVDDVWGNGDFKVYSGCSIAGMNVNEQGSNLQFALVLSEVVLLCIGTMCLGVSNCIILYKVRCISKKQFKSFEGPDVIIRNTNKRLLMLNRIFCMVIAGVIVVEIPLLVFYGFFFYQTFAFASYGGSGILSTQIVDIWIFIVYDIFAPLDVFLFMINSKKIKSMVIRSLRCRRGDKMNQQVTKTTRSKS